jgi:hypothetical protein
MKIFLFHHQDIVNGMQLTTLTHVKCTDGEGRHLAFAKITPALLECIRNLELEVPDSLCNWKGKTECSPNTPSTI